MAISVLYSEPYTGGLQIRASDNERGTRRRAQKQQLKHAASESYRLRFTKALNAELDVEMQQMKERLQCWPRKRLEDEGYALFDLSVRADSQLYRSRIFRFFRAFGNGILPRHHQFSQGDIVTISTGNPLAEEDDVVEGIVVERAQRFLRVAVQKNTSKIINSNTQWRLDISANSISHGRCVMAVDYFSSGKPISSLSNIFHGPSEVFTYGEAANAVKNLILTPEANIHMANGTPDRISGSKLGQFKGAFRKIISEIKELNPSQKTAIQTALCRRVTLWQGPPGTGKTRTLVQFIAVHCKLGQGKVLASADSNVAVDNLLEGLLAEGLHVIRIGQPVKVKEELRTVTLEAQISAHPLMKKVNQLQDYSKATKQQSRKSNNVKTAESTWQEAVDLEARVIQDVFSRAEVVAATCVGAGDPVLDGQCFTACVIDEATQATEPACAIPLLRSGADCFVLVGDPAQLPPTVVSNDAIKEGLDVSLFEHLQQRGLTALLLDTQYRMHPVLADFPSRTFYGGRLLSQPLPSERKAPKGYNWPNLDKPLVFINCPDGKELVLHDNSFQNQLEASEAVKVVKQLISGGDINSECIGIIAPYSAQAFARPLLCENEDSAKLEIKTVDGFQGREKEAIVLCTVRSNTEGNIGFVADRRRMNVALTRAKRGLIVIGNYSTLKSSSYWQTLLNEMLKQGLLV